MTGGGCQMPKTAASCRLPGSARAADGRALPPIRERTLSMTSSDPTPRQIIVFMLYSVLCLPASVTVASYVAARITRNVSNFEGGAGYAALWGIILLTCAFNALSIVVGALLRKRRAILAVVTVGAAVLSVPTFRLVQDLAT